MIAIIDYGVGNLFSLYSSLKFIGAEAVITSSPEEIKKAEQNNTAWGWRFRRRSGQAPLKRTR